MDRLTTFGLCSSFFLLGPMITFCCLLFLLYNGHIAFNYFSLFFLNILFTYSFNGFFGVLYSLVSCMIMVSCGIMYWYDLSPSDLKNELKSPIHNKNVLLIKDYASKGAQKIYQITGLSDDKITKLKIGYIECSKKFDYYSDIVWKLLYNFYEMMKDVKGFKELFFYFSIVFKLLCSIDSIKHLHKLSRNFNMNSMPLGPYTENNKRDKPFNQMMDPGAMDLGMMSDQLNNMSPGQKKSIDDMTKQIFENININDMMSMMQGSGNLMKPKTGAMDLGMMSDQLNNMSPGQKKSIDDMTKQIFENININDMMSMMQGSGNLTKPKTGAINKKKN